MIRSTVGMKGELNTKLISRYSKSGPGLRWKLRNNLRKDFIMGWLAWYIILPIAHFFGVMTVMSELRARHIEREWDEEAQDYLPTHITDYGVIGRRVVTTAFAEFLVDQLIAETSEFGDFKFHDSGIGTTAAVIADTDIETTDGESRATGTQVESTSLIYRSVGTITYTSTLAITEHGLFSKATGTTLLDRTVFAAINVVNTDQIEFTFDATVATGG